VAASTGSEQASVGETLREPRGRPRLRRLAWWCVFILAGLLLWAAYLRVSRTVPVNSDGASQALEAWDILHGNPLLRGWWLSDVSFYTTELPEYVLVESLRGLNADVMHVSASLTYTLLVLFTALLARGRATGRAAVASMLLAAGIVIAPQLGDGADILLLNPDHVGTAVVVMAILLLLDRAGRRWWLPAAIGMLLAWAFVADTIVLYTAVLPLVAACGVRAFQEVVRRRRSVTDVWFELAVAAAAVAAVPAALIVPVVIHAKGGYFAWPASLTVIPVGKIAANVPPFLEGLALLFGCSFAGLHPGLGLALAILHLAGAALAAAGVAAGVRRFFRETSLVTRALTVAVLLDVAGYLVRTVLTSPLFAHEIAAVLPFSAVLAGRLLAGRLVGVRLPGFRLAGTRLPGARLAPVLVAVLLGYVLSLGYDAAQPSVPAADSQLTAWLASHHLGDGLAGFWNAEVIRLSSGDRVQVSPVCYGPTGMVMEHWEAQTSWYNPSRHRVTFLLTDSGKDGTYAHEGFSAAGMHTLGNRNWGLCYQPDYSQIVAAFGIPARTYLVGQDTVMVWNENLLTRLR
jgi:hypothetical protein